MNEDDIAVLTASPAFHLFRSGDLTAEQFLEKLGNLLQMLVDNGNALDIDCLEIVAKAIDLALNDD